MYETSAERFQGQDGAVARCRSHIDRVYNDLGISIALLSPAAQNVSNARTVHGV